MSKKIENIVFDIAKPITDEFNFELVDCEYVKEGADKVLYIYIDKPEGITIEDCEKVSRRVEEVLDALDPIPEQYYLSVSSPGIDRPLKRKRDFEKNLGKDIDIKLYKPRDGKKEFSGKLTAFEENNWAQVETDGEILNFKLTDVAIIRPNIDSLFK